MNKKINLNCNWCLSSFEKEEKFYKYELKLTPNKKFYCSRKCFNQYTTKNTQCFNCLNCQKEFKVVHSIAEKTKFCSQSCSAIFNNAKRSSENYSTKGKTKELICSICNATYIGSIHSPTKSFCLICKKQQEKFRSKKFSKKYYIKKSKRIRKKKNKNCIRCNVSFLGINGKYCNACKPGLGYHKRSWNEIMFGHLCAKYWHCKFNENIFNCWDADIIIPELKIAVLWNGPWHYQNVIGNSVKQVQNRDKIKIKEIIKLGYYPYIIMDKEKASWRKVEKEFLCFLQYLEDVRFKQVISNFAQENPHINFHEYYEKSLELNDSSS